MTINEKLLWIIGMEQSPDAIPTIIKGTRFNTFNLLPNPMNKLDRFYEHLRSKKYMKQKKNHCSSKSKNKFKSYFDVSVMGWSHYIS